MIFELINRAKYWCPLFSMFCNRISMEMLWPKLLLSNRVEILLIPCLGLAFAVNHEFSFFEVTWTFSLYLDPEVKGGWNLHISLPHPDGSLPCSLHCQLDLSLLQWRLLWLGRHRGRNSPDPPLHPLPGSLLLHWCKASPVPASGSLKESARTPLTRFHLIVVSL